MSLNLPLFSPKTTIRSQHQPLGVVSPFFCLCASPKEGAPASQFFGISTPPLLSKFFVVPTHLRFGTTRFLEVPPAPLPAPSGWTGDIFKGALSSFFIVWLSNLAPLKALVFPRFFFSSPNFPSPPPIPLPRRSLQPEQILRMKVKDSSGTGPFPFVPALVFSEPRMSFTFPSPVGNGPTFFSGGGFKTVDVPWTFTHDCFTYVRNLPCSLVLFASHSPSFSLKPPDEIRSGYHPLSSLPALTFPCSVLIGQ